MKLDFKKFILVFFALEFYKTRFTTNFVLAEELMKAEINCFVLLHIICTTNYVYFTRLK